MCSRAEEAAAVRKGGAGGEGSGDGEGEGEGGADAGDAREGNGREEAMSSPNLKESKLLDVFDDDYQLANEAHVARPPHERCCEPTTLRDLVAGEGIAFGDQPCEFHTDEFYHSEFVYE